MSISTFRSIYYILFILTLSISCKNENKEVKLARFNDVFLYQSELINEIPITLNENDSAIFANNYIHKWLVDQMIMEKSEEMIPLKFNSVEKKINKYKRSLITYEFEQFYINKRLDTSISYLEINDYYTSHLDDFVLNDYVVKCMYIKVPKKSKIIKDVKKNYHIINEKMVDQMVKLGQKENVKFYYNPEEWIFFDDLLKELPILENYSKVEFIKKKKKTIIEYNDYVYFVNIFDFIIKNGTSPLSFETNKIKSIILNRRSRDLRKKLRLDLYDDGMRNNYIEKYRL
ncbi:MAG: hypothetical protein CND37_01095 [Bacteroidetes bacterium MED-G20]|mgnify:CR=1 FL=1|nr:MAG: hypothetical protein CND37_01095 [Bacteroidetes bacterium MED-G20]